MDKQIFTVSDIAGDLKAIIEDNFAHVWISGELSNAKRHSSGHFYFTLKDDTAQLSGAMWRPQAMRLKFRPEDGMKVIVGGRLSFYAQQGKTQLYAEVIEPDGVGALQLAFEKLKALLEQEGLFAAARKRPLPMVPRKVGIITSETGAVIHDLITNMKRRFPPIDIVLAPAKVQGDGAAADIAKQIVIMNSRADIDVLIVGRGGGSLEDLWAFNDEGVARAIFASRIPVISAVGHENDFTIADFVADVRASTPTAAAELAVPLRDDLLYTLDAKRQRLIYCTTHFLTHRRERVRYCGSRLRDPRQAFSLHRERHRRLYTQLSTAMTGKLRAARTRHYLSLEKLRLLSPLAILDRGYAIVVRPTAPTTPLKTPAGIAPGDVLDVQLAGGKLRVASV